MASRSRPLKRRRKRTTTATSTRDFAITDEDHCILGPTSFPILRRSTKSLVRNLMEREYGMVRSISSWQNHVLREKESWRPYLLRQVQFTALETPVSDAVLGLSRDGSYAVALSNGGLFRCYGLPSPAVHLKRAVAVRHSGRHHLVVSPILLSVPLEWNDEEEIPSPTMLILSHSLGVALTRPSYFDTTWPGARKQAHITVFAMPPLQKSEFATSFRLSQIAVPLSFDVKKCFTMLDPSLYLSVIDDCEGFLLTWFSFQRKNSLEIPFKSGFVLKSEEHDWETVVCNRLTGQMVFDSEPDGLFIAQEARLDIPALRKEILKRHPNQKCQADFVYDLIRVVDTKIFLVLTLILMSGVPVAVILEFDWSTHEIIELQWVKSTTSSTSLHDWTRSFGLSWLENKLLSKKGSQDENPDILLLDNRAVLAERPVTRITCQAPVELVYG